MARDAGPIRYAQERRYTMSVSEAWRILADTDHLNRSIGLPAVEFSPLEGDPLVRRARTRAYGVVPVRWREFPFDWVRERRYAVRREFESGPIDWLVGGLELAPAGGDGVSVEAYAHFVPRNVTGKFLWRLGRTPVTGLLEFCELYLGRKAAGKVDPVPVPKGRTKVDVALLDAGLATLGRTGVQPSLVALLRERVVEGSDDQLTNIRAYELADRWHADRGAVLLLMLHATRARLFEARWQLLCPNCRVPKAEAPTLPELPPRFHCDTCGISYDADRGRTVELRFGVAPAVRSVRSDIYCIGGPLRMPHVVAQQFIAPQEHRRLELPLREPLSLQTIGGQNRLALSPAPPSSRVTDVKLSYAAGRWSGPHSLLAGDTLNVPEGASLTLRNQTDGPVLARVEELAWTRDATTAAEAFQLDEFRDVLGDDLPSWP